MFPARENGSVIRTCDTRGSTTRGIHPPQIDAAAGSCRIECENGALPGSNRSVQKHGVEEVKANGIQAAAHEALWDSGGMMSEMKCCRLLGCRKKDRSIETCDPSIGSRLERLDHLRWSLGNVARSRAAVPGMVVGLRHGRFAMRGAHPRSGSPQTEHESHRQGDQSICR